MQGVPEYSFLSPRRRPVSIVSKTNRIDSRLRGNDEKMVPGFRRDDISVFLIITRSDSDVVIYRQELRLPHFARTVE